MISIIIPTLNEEKHLPFLLESLKEQTFNDFEVIVSDAGSEDKTRKIAKDWKCKVAEGGLPAKGRNNGAEIAQGEILFFLDADVVLPKDFLEEAVKEFKKRKLVIAGCYVQPLSDKDIDSLLYGTANLYFKFTQFLFPQAAGHCIIAKKEIHKKIGGFNEKIKVAEDFDYVKRAAKEGKFRYLENVKIPVLMRRLDREGRMNMAVKYAFIGLYFSLFGGIKSDIFNYRFAHYNEKKESFREKLESLNLQIKLTSIIKSIEAREIIDSRGNPAVEVELWINGSSFRASVPSGASTGNFEAKELRDNDLKRYEGKGVLKAIKNIEKIISPKLKGKYVLNQKKLDSLLIDLDGTKDKSKLGANALLAVSMAICRAGADAKHIPLYHYIADIYHNKTLTSYNKKLFLPIPCFNVINGGAHAGNNLDIQEFMLVPQAKTFSSNLRKGVEVYHSLKEILKKEFGKQAVNLGDEGGFAPPIEKAEESLELIMRAINKAGYSGKIKIGLDVAATELLSKNKYCLEGKEFSSGELVDFYEKLIKKFPIIFIEDPFGEKDFKGFSELNKKIGGKVIILGDDLLTTNTERIKKAQVKKACNGTIIKPNQIGTVTEAIQAIKLAKSYNWKVLVSHRSGDTEDSFISDLAVGAGADFIKSGAPARAERTAKYNQLLRIEERIK
jgi:enolase